MYIREFPNCCGIYVIIDFGHTATNGEDLNKRYFPTEQEVYDYLKEKEEKGGVGMLVATINGVQKNKIGNAFKRRRWKLASKCLHKGHGNNIYLYTKVLNKPKEE